MAGLITTAPAASMTPTEITAAIAAAVPKPSTAPPAGVADTSSVGTDPSKYSIEGHVHAAKARKGRQAVSAATYTWTYPTAFASGVIPICNGIAECAVGTADLINVQLDGTPTNTSCKFKITRYTQGVVGLVSGVLAINATPLAIVLHMTAFEP